MVYLIHLERTRTEVKHCIAILNNQATETLDIYYVQPGSRLMANLLALGVQWTVIRLWDEGPWYDRWRRTFRPAAHVCPICEVKC